MWEGQLVPFSNHAFVAYWGSDEFVVLTVLARALIISPVTRSSNIFTISLGVRSKRSVADSCTMSPASCSRLIPVRGMMARYAILRSVVVSKSCITRPSFQPSVSSGRVPSSVVLQRSKVFVSLVSRRKLPLRAVPDSSVVGHSASQGPGELQSPG